MSHIDYKFSVSVHSDDLAVVNCLRSLSAFSQQTGNARIPWGGTKEKDWQRDAHTVTFHFTSPLFRAGFLTQARRLLPVALWSVVGQSDNDPASPQS